MKCRLSSKHTLVVKCNNTDSIYFVNNNLVYYIDRHYVPLLPLRCLKTQGRILGWAAVTFNNFVYI